MAHPERSRVVSQPVLFPSVGTTGDDYSSDANGCHDITAYPERDLAAGACMGDGILLDISDRAHPPRDRPGARDPELRLLALRHLQSDTENCVAHNGSLVPVEGLDIMVQAWYQGGTSVWEFTDPRKPTELAHFDRGAISDSELVFGGSWSSYWYNGYVYSSDITRGLEVFTVRAPWATKASKVKQSVFNPQSQPSFNG